MQAFVLRRLHAAAVCFVCLLLVEAGLIRVDGFVFSTATLPRLELSTTTTAVRTKTARRMTTLMSSSTGSKRGKRSREDEKKRTPREIAGESKVGERATCTMQRIMSSTILLVMPSAGTCVCRLLVDYLYFVSTAYERTPAVSVYQFKLAEYRSVVALAR